MIKKVLIIGIANLVAGMALTFVFGIIFPELALEYQKPGLFRSWSDPLMSLFFAYPFIFAIVASYLWNFVKEKFKGSAASKANQFAILYFIIATIPGMFASYTSFLVSFPMVLSWSISGLVYAWISGYIFAKMK